MDKPFIAGTSYLHWDGARDCSARGPWTTSSARLWYVFQFQHLYHLLFDLRQAFAAFVIRVAAETELANWWRACPSLYETHLVNSKRVLRPCVYDDGMAVWVVWV